MPDLAVASRPAARRRSRGAAIRWGAAASIVASLGPAGRSWGAEAVTDIAPTPTPEGPRSRALSDRAGTAFLAGFGMLALPAVDSCPNTRAPCRGGTTSLALSLASLARWPRVSVGAGALVAFGLRPDAAMPSPGREHGRSAFLVDAMARYHVPLSRRAEWWFGGTVGAVVLHDTWSTPAERAPYLDLQRVGPQRLGLRTEGLGIGPAVGAQWTWRDRWVLGTQLRYLQWLLPAERRRTAFGDAASLAGRVDVLDFGILLGFQGGW